MAQPSRSARAAVLASSVQRSKPTPYPLKARSALIRRTVVVVLVLVALTLVTISFRSPTAGALHGVQGAGSTALRPFQIAATRVAQPFRDAYDYVNGLTKAKSENERLKRELVQYRSAQIAERAAAVKEQELETLLQYEHGPTFPKDYRVVNAAVIGTPSGPFTHTLAIAAGSSRGVRLNSPVVSGDGLVGRVSNVLPNSAKVTLLTNRDSSVAARDLNHNVRGIVQWWQGGTLVLSEVPKQQQVEEGDQIVTDGTHNASYPSIYPYGIPIGRVSHVGLFDTVAFLQVQVQPYANLGSLDGVGVLVSTKQRR